MTEPRVVYVGADESTKNSLVLRCLTCLHRPLVIDTAAHEAHRHPFKN